MRTNKFIYSLSVLALTFGLIISACKKKDPKPEEPAIVTEDGQTSMDNRWAQTENDLAISDINTEVSNSAALHGKSSSGANVNALHAALNMAITDYTVDTTGAYTGTIKINYNGTVVNNRKRTGSIKLSIPNYPAKKWKDAGCVLKVEYINYKIMRVSDAKTMKVNGTQNITNESGGSWWELIVLTSQPNLVTTVTGSFLYVAFDSTKTAVYNINRRFTYTMPNNILTCQCEGIGTYNGLTQLENYGANRDGIVFTSQVIAPVIWKLNCGAHAPVQGEMSIKANDRNFTLKVLYSVDANGKLVNVLSNTCPYGWKVEWINNSVPGKRVFAYN
ncbi:MAG: hypothetical protein H0W73_10230 [Bacteroidetes bacterium]|nr:hypothetical protein [Bacteroidota bacterium]